MTIFDTLNNPPLWLKVLAVFIVFCQGLWIFRDAQKRGVYPWLWGIWGITSAPIPLLFYYFFVIKKKKRL